LGGISTELNKLEAGGGQIEEPMGSYSGPVWQGSGSSKNSSGSGFSNGAASLVELEPF